MEAERPRVEVRDSPNRCPFCHESCTAADEHVACRECLARHHRACWDESGACAACSSDQRLEPAQAERPRAREGASRARLSLRAVASVGLVVCAAFVAWFLCGPGLRFRDTWSPSHALPILLLILCAVTGWVSRSQGHVVAAVVAAVVFGYVGGVLYEPHRFGPEIGGWLLGVVPFCLVLGFIAVDRAGRVGDAAPVRRIPRRRREASGDET